jgi:hypothetical protein
MTRREPRREDPYAFTALAHHEQASAWSRGLLYGGMIGVLAFTLAIGWNQAGPGARRRRRDIAAPVWQRTPRN